MYEVKVVIVSGNVRQSVTIATFERDEQVLDYTRARAIAFARQIDSGFEVSVINVEDEDNRDKAFGLVWAHVPGDGGRKWDGVS